MSGELPPINSASVKYSIAKASVAPLQQSGPVGGALVYFPAQNSEGFVDARICRKPESCRRFWP
jgi:hypothetical protein